MAELTYADFKAMAAKTRAALEKTNSENAATPSIRKAAPVLEKKVDALAAPKRPSARTTSTSSPFGGIYDKTPLFKKERAEQMKAADLAVMAATSTTPARTTSTSSPFGGIYDKTPLFKKERAELSQAADKCNSIPATLPASTSNPFGGIYDKTPLYKKERAEMPKAADGTSTTASRPTTTRPAKVFSRFVRPPLILNKNGIKLNCFKTTKRRKFFPKDYLEKPKYWTPEKIAKVKAMEDRLLAKWPANFLTLEQNFRFLMATGLIPFNISKSKMERFNLIQAHIRFWGAVIFIKLRKMEKIFPREKPLMFESIADMKQKMFPYMPTEHFVKYFNALISMKLLRYWQHENSVSFYCVDSEIFDQGKISPGKIHWIMCNPEQFKPCKKMVSENFLEGIETPRIYNFLDVLKDK